MNPKEYLQPEHWNQLEEWYKNGQTWAELPKVFVPLLRACLVRNENKRKGLNQFLTLTELE